MTSAYRALLLALVLALWGSQDAAGQGTARFQWQRFDVDITLLLDGTFNVVETQVIQSAAPLSRGYREIRLNRIGGITEIAVEEPGLPYSRGSGQPYTFSASRSDDLIRIDWWFPPSAASTREFVVRYRVDDAIRVYEAGDQLYWTVLGPDLPARVDSSRVTVHFPSDVRVTDLKLAAYPEGVAGPPRRVDPRTVEFIARDIPAGGRFEVRVQFPHGLVRADVPDWQRQADIAAWYERNARPVLNFAMLLLSLAILGVGGALLAGLWFARGNDPAIGKVPAVLDAPPSDLPAGIVGTLVDEHADVQDVVATLVELGNRGIIKITEEQNPDLVGSNLDYRLDLLAPGRVGLRSYKKTLLATLFPAGQRTVRLSDLRDRFRAAIPLFQDQLHAEVASEGLFVENPAVVRSRYRRAGIILVAMGAVGALVGVLALAQYVDLAPVPFACLAVVGGVAWWLSSAMPRRTRLGAVEAAKWRAFGRFLRGADARKDVLAGDAGQAWMPYAIALGADRTWLRKLDSVGSLRPRWFSPVSQSSAAEGSGDSQVILWPSPGGWGGGSGPREGHRPAETSTPTAPHTDSRGRDSGWPSLQSWSDRLADLLNRTSDVLSQGGGDWSVSDWSGGDLGDSGSSGGGGGGFE